MTSTFSGQQHADLASRPLFFTRVVDPAFIADTLRTCGAPLTGEPGPKGPTVPEAELQVIERLLRVYRRTNLVCLQDGKLSSLFSDYHWPGIQQRLVENDIVKLEDRATSGRPKQFLRSRFLPGQIAQVSPAPRSTTKSISAPPAVR